MKRLWFGLCVTLTLVTSVMAKDSEFTVHIVGGKEPAKNVIVTAPAPGPLTGSVSVTDSAGKVHVGQIAAAPLSSGRDAKLLYVVLPEVKADEKITLTAAPAPSSVGGFSWKDVDGTEPTLLLDGKPLLKYQRPTFDPKLTVGKDTMRNPTIKPFHHLFDASGVQLTNGAEGKFPHHRGIYFGFNKCQYDGKTADVWHGREGASQAHLKTLASEAGPLLGRHRVLIAWNGNDGKTFAEETRELTAFRTSGGTLLTFESVLKPTVEKLHLDGDPQHAGFHFRASQEVESKNSAKTYFLRPDGKGELGKTINWEPKKGGPTNLPWDAMSFMVGTKRYTVLYLDHPSNPKESRSSERDYGRFGNYFEADVTKAKPLSVKYRLFVTEGELTGEQAKAMSAGFVNESMMVKP